MHFLAKAIQYPQKAFSLLELLAVISILGIFVCIIFSGATHLSQKRYLYQARGELAHIQQALEKYRFLHGNYPQGDTADLVNKLNLSQTENSTFLDLKILSISDGLIQDPWGRPYVYKFDIGQRANMYQLYSLGPNEDILEDDIIAK